MTEEDIRKDLVSVLLGAYTGAKVKLPRKRSKADWFAGVLKIASRASTVQAALDKLAKKTDPAWWQPDPEIVERLDAQREEALRIWHDETMYLATAISVEAQKKFALKGNKSLENFEKGKA